jgi:putative tricarboxylic transport membrane protein
MKAGKGELALALLFVALGALWVVRAVQMPLWDGFAPSSGFLPLAYGALLVALAVAAVVQLRKSAPTDEPVRKPVTVLGALAVAVAALPFAGFAISVFALLLFLYAGIERLRIVPSLIVSAGTTGVLYLLFKTWLGVPLP